jgi:LAO/AO transport system kinase
MARRSWSTEELIEGVRTGDARALARAISLVENRHPAGLEVLRALYPATGSAFSIGVTGPPGVGKSSLIGALVGHARSLGLAVGVVSVDPSSPFTHGALLGDRIRLTDHFLDPEVFIRSMGSRGHAGGLAEAALQSLLLLDAAGKDVVLLETVGTGQGEIEVMGVADAVLLVLMPGAGDSVQALKAGIMEIPDVIAVNKMDLPGAGAMQSDLRAVLSLAPGAQPAVLQTEAHRGEGVTQLWDELVARRDALAASGELEERRRRNLEREVVSAATARMRAAAERALADDPELTALVAAVGRREVDPLTAVDTLVAAVTAGAEL